MEIFPPPNMAKKYPQTTKKVVGAGKLATYKF